jgi:hypothetical protein
MFRLIPIALSASFLVACGTVDPSVWLSNAVRGDIQSPIQLPVKLPIQLGAGSAKVCADLVTTDTPATTPATTISGAAIGLPSGAAMVDKAVLVDASALKVAERGPTPAAMVTPATPAYCQLLGRIAPVDPKAPFIHFQVNLPLEWNGRSVQYGGGGFNGVLINALGLVPAAPFDVPAPLAQGYVTYGTDSGHQNKAGEPPQTFALNDEALVNFAHASYKKVRDVAVELMRRSYGMAPQKLYFVGSSEGGREGLTMAQRYPADFDGIFSRVPVIHWTGLQHAGLRDGKALMNGGWMAPAQVKLVHDAVLAACDGADGVVDGIVSDPVVCRELFDVRKLQCAEVKAGDAKTAADKAADTKPAACLTAPQVKAIQTLHSRLPIGVEIANGLRDYPGRGPSGEGTPAFGPTGGWMSWWTCASAPTMPAQPSSGITWFYGAGAIQYFYARDAQYDLSKYRIEDHAPRVREISNLMDSTNPDLSAFHARGGKLIILENRADYAQSPYAGIEYHQSVQRHMGRAKTQEFTRLYTASGVDHVGSGAPSNVDMLGALSAWVERGVAPTGLTLQDQAPKLPFTTSRARPLCEWPQIPRYLGGDVNSAGSFACRL